MGQDAGRRLFIFLQVQAAAGLVLVLSVFAAAHNPAPGLGAQGRARRLVFLGALAGAAVSDEQLRRFKADPANRGKVCEVGPLGLFAPPELFLRMARLARLPGDRHLRASIPGASPPSPRRS